MMELLTVDLISAARCIAIANELRDIAGSAAPVYGTSQSGAVEQHVRKASRLEPTAETREFVRSALLAVKQTLADHFGRPLTTCEEPQFLRYEPGDYFVAHQDGNTPVIYDDSRHRRVSAIVFLSRPGDGEPGDYSGGTLVFHGGFSEPTRRLTAAAAQGSLLAFPPELTHEVTPVLTGVRYSIATWYR